ncbi:MAG: uroporphyrinogen decarboxylase family protein [Ruthenibacterium sp.]
MTSRERVIAALDFKPVDKAPLEYHPCSRGFFEHGEPFRRLLKELPGDFEDFSDGEIPVMPKDAIDENGSYHALETDAWGVEWESRIFAMLGHPKHQPLADWSALASFHCPPHSLADPRVFANYKAHVEKMKETQFVKAGWVGFFEKMHALRPFEDVLMDVYEDETEINYLADMLVDYQIEEMQYLIDAGVDAIQFGDDFGTNDTMLLSPEVWRSFFKPRYRRLVQKAKENGKKVFFHSCGYVMPIFADLKEIGVDAVWPQQTAYNLHDLAAYLKKLGLACALHIDRAEIMTHGTPQDVVCATRKTAQAFDIMNGGAFFYVETDNGFPFKNIEALLHTIAEYRR